MPGSHQGWAQEFEEGIEHPEMQACRLAFLHAVGAPETGSGAVAPPPPPQTVLVTDRRP
ncbi:MAG: hypothetical protein ACK4WC_01320 [Rubrimonas sp.]